MRDLRALVLALPLTLSACLAPKYVQPDSGVADAFPGATEDVDGAVAAADLGWREVLRDPHLQALIDTALENNRDLRLAMLQVDRAKAAYRITIANRIPDLNLEASATTSRSVFGPGLAAEGTVYRVGVSMPAFELDLFGRLHQESQAALHRYLATEQGARTARISLIGQVATGWLAERSLAEQQALADRTRASRVDALDLVRDRFDAGVVSELDLRQAESLVAQADATVASLTREHAQAIGTLTLLVGAPIAAAVDVTPLADVDLANRLPAGLPSDLLQRRPDIRAAEERLRAANADIGAARAAFFPRISLTGSVGTASSDLGALFTAGTGVWSFIPALVQPLFGIARNIANLKVSEVDKKIAVATYDKTVQEAFRDVANALVAREPLDAQVAALTALRDAESDRAVLAQQRYDAGVSSYLDVLDAQRSLLDAERTLVQVRELRLVNTVTLYEALGGGVAEHTAVAAAP
ncbi:MAG: efflux transporter outer membrane subunit [Alphaproteobacteria bacterium]|nr:efflux transporter outer membrane subunit [Alphaproteobacteria bacterium]